MLSIMSRLVTEVRLLVAEWLLGVVFSVAPFGGEGEAIKVMIAYYFDGKVKQHKK